MGPYYFAWVDDDETEFSETLYAREDEEVYAFELTHEEGDFPSLTVEVKNPRIGLLAPARKVWAWFSYEHPTLGVTPLFFGRLVGIPNNIFAEVVTLEFIARPKTYLADKQSAANALMVAPYYNAAWLVEDRRTDPDAVLEGYSRLWHIDRTTLEVTTSDIIAGEDGVETWTEDDIFYDSVSVSLGQVPLTALTVKASVAWGQRMSQSFRVTTGIVRAMNGESIMASWPKPGASLGGGWVCTTSKCIDTRNVANAEVIEVSAEWENQNKEHSNGDTLSSSFSSSTPAPGTEFIRHPQTSSYQPGYVNPYGDPPMNRSAKASSSTQYHLVWTLDTELSVAMAATRSRRESIEFTVTADFQRILTDVTDASDREELTISAAEMADSGNGVYFTTEAGASSVEYLLALARAKLLFRCRAVRIEFECPVDKVLNLSCRKNGLVYDSRLPGGSAVGKVVGYKIRLSGDDGQLTASVSLASSIGYGNSVAAVPGEPTYVEDGYVDDGYQARTGQTSVLPGGDIGYSTPVPTVSPFDSGSFVIESQWKGDFDGQVEFIQQRVAADGVWDLVGWRGFGEIEEASEKTAASVAAVNQYVKENPVYFSLKLKDLQKGFDIPYTMATASLTAPKQIDLEAPSNA